MVASLRRHQKLSPCQTEPVSAGSKRLMPEQAPGRTCGPIERSPHWAKFSGSSSDPVACPCWSNLFLKDWSPSKGPILEQLVKNCTLGEGSILKFMGKCLPWVGPHTGAEKKRKGEGIVEVTFVLNYPQSPFYILLHCSVGGGRETESKVEPGKKGEVQGRCFEISLFSLSCSVADSKLISLSRVCFDHECNC